jgi:hypothetical protein
MRLMKACYRLHMAYITSNSMTRFAIFILENRKYRIYFSYQYINYRIFIIQQY